MSQSELVDALADGALVVTPGNRLARDVAMRFDAARVAHGDAAWSSPSVLPWALWLDRLWLASLAAGANDGRVLLEPNTARELWFAIVKSDPSDLLNARGAARHALDAWTMFHGWRTPGETLRSAAARGHGGDVATFASWAEQYQRRLDALAAIDGAQLPDSIARAAPALAAALPRIVLRGFLTMTPQQHRLVAALRDAGAAIDDARDTQRTAPRGSRTSCATPARAVARALTFARARVAADPAARVAIVVANLHERRTEVEALAEEILCPERLLALQADAPRPYGISLAEPLAAAPIVACALDLIALACGSVDASVAAALARAPFLPDASTRWTRRADAERSWRRDGRRDVGWSDFVSALGRADPALHDRLVAAVPPTRAARLPRDWARAWSAWLEAIGWPGNATLSSAQWQARDAWSGAVAKFAATGAVRGSVTPTAAFEALRSLLDDTLFQPEAPPAGVQILGSLEAVGLSFDAAWLVGFDAQRWPPAVTPNPFLPLTWQHGRAVPRAHPDAALADARALTHALARIAGDVVVSHAAMIDDAPAVISPLFADWPEVELPALPSARFVDAFATAALERIADGRAPALARGAYVRGGAQLFDSQSACPFQAFARFRLQAEAWRPCPDGLSAAERGTVLHAMLAAFWDDVRDHATLVALAPDALQLRIDAAIRAGKAKLPPARWRALPPAVADSESHRLAATLSAWIEDHERSRMPFTAHANERAIETIIEGVAVKVRIDRIDALPSGGVLIIDYKSGRVVAPARWFAPRPEGIQLAVYAHAVEHGGDERVRGLAFAQLKAGEIDVKGLAEDADVWPALDIASSSNLPVADFARARALLGDELASLARDVAAGDARVAPRVASTCQYCGLQPLCRIRRLDDGSGGTEAPGD